MFYAQYLSRMIQLRNVPDALHRKPKSRVALARMALSDYLIGRIREIAERPTLEEMRARLERRSRVNLSIATADLFRNAIGDDGSGCVGYAGSTDAE